MRLCRTSFLTLGAVGLSSAFLAERPAIAAVKARATGAAESPEPARSERLSFAYHSNFWLNLHHRLYRFADVLAWERQGHRLEAEAPSRWKAQGLELSADFKALPPEQRQTWNASVQVYIDGDYVKADLLFDDRLTAIKEALSRLSPGAEPQVSATIPETLQRALVSAAAIYRTSHWTADNNSNFAWISGVKPRVGMYGAELTHRLRRIYQWDWPIGPYRIDVVRYANVLGAYTSTGPIHIVISSGDPNYAGTAALEMLFHEASHSVITADFSTIGSAIENASTILAKAEPDGLWHAVIFYTVGSVVADLIERQQHERYTMYADVAGVFRGPWQRYREPLARFWQPYMDGKGSLAGALTATVKAIVS